MSATLFDAVVNELKALFDPVTLAVEDPGWRDHLLFALGINQQEAAAPLVELLARVVELERELAALADSQSPSFDGVTALLDSANGAFAALRSVDNEGTPAALRGLGEALVQVLVGAYLSARYPLLFRLGVLLTVIEPAEEAAPTEQIVTGDEVLRTSVAIARVLPRRLVDLLRDPVSVLKAEYLNDLATAEDADAAADKLFPRVADVLTALDIPWTFGLEARTRQLLDEAAPLIDHALTVFFQEKASGAAANVGFTLAFSSADRGDLGLVVCPFGTLTFLKQFGIWSFELGFTAEVEALAYGHHGLTLVASPETTQVQGHVAVTLAAPADGPAFVFGSSTGTRLEVGGAQIKAETALSEADQSLAISASVSSSQIVITPGDGDGFLSSILPIDGLQAKFDLGLAWSNERGLTFCGAGNLDATLPVGLSIRDVLTVPTIHLSLRVGETGLAAEVSASVGVSIGPVHAAIERTGIATVVTFPEDGGNLGVANLDFRFKPPDGVGLSIDGGGFSGGGFLRHIEADQRYEGMLELEYEDKISLKAIGLLTTRLPGGQPGFSLLIIITAEFTPIQLGMGFTLNGVGGLLSLNRTADTERLRSGLRDNTLSSVLFPQSVVENASRILSDLNQLFPVQPDRFIFGPMARIGWGSPTLITIDLGLLVEIPDPVRVLILGVIRALLPDEKAKVLQLQVNFLGVIDFEAQRLSFDASLYDSKLLSFTLSGDMAVRVSWGADRNLLLTVGGFHPAYQPPPLNLPTLRRLSLQLNAGDNPRLTLETYFAITSNTHQFGARAELLAKAGSFSVYGFLSFDVLFQFNPFYFIASNSAKLALLAGSSEIASISLDFTLEGPTPWHVKGTAKLKICWFLTIKVSFDKTFGELLDILLPDIPVLPLLRAALSDPGNWEAQPTGGRRQLVSFKEVEASGDQVMAAPFGVLTIQQRVAPLGIEIQRFGSQRPADGKHFAIEQVLAGEEGDTETLATSGVSEQFAPAQFFELTDAQKLSSKSFERFESGVKLTDSEAFEGEYAVRREVDYELFYIDKQRDLVPQGEPLRPDFLTFHSWALRGAVANSPLSQARNGKSTLAPEAVQVSQEGFAVVRASDLRPVAAGAQVASEAGAQGLMVGLVRDNPALEGEILVVPTFEVNLS